MDQEQTVRTWRDEYGRRGIPSSIRDHPSGSVVEFMEFLRENRVEGGVAVDVGCGMGRNSVFLALNGFEVHGIDIVPENVAVLRASAEASSVADRVSGHPQSVTDPWPLDAYQADVVIDTFCYKHQIEADERERYRRELVRVLKPGGHFLLTLAGVDDGYYGPLLAVSPDPVGRVIIDPKNGISSVLFDRDDVEREFSPMIRFVHHRYKRQEGEMHGETYLRSTHLFIGVRQDVRASAIHSVAARGH